MTGYLPADPWTVLFAAVAGVLGVLASGHALINKRRPRSAFGWIAVCLMFPLAGAALYYLFGVNRTRRRAQRLREDDLPEPAAAAFTVEPEEALAPLARLGEAVSGGPLLAGNDVEILHGGEAAYPAMLEAIDTAAERVLLSSYIFDRDDTGTAFADALGRAVDRGVEVRVLLDGVGELYSWPRARHLLARRGVDVRRFLPPRLLPPSFMINLRNHRKILLVDDRVGFTGGMNVSDRHLLARAPAGRRDRRVVDVHFALRGPVLDRLLAIFDSDWAFAGGPERHHRLTPVRAGEARCRAIADGPDEELDRLLLLITGAIGLARRRVAIMTPYFVPPRELLGALQAAALRGVDVAILLPAHNNLFFVHRATRHLLWELLQRGVRVHYQPGPFVHSKLLLVDDDYAQIGSANLDPRSLRLNFELTVEVFDRPTVTALWAHVEAARAQSPEVTLADVDGRRLGTRLVDGVAWLFSPYL
ncbi:MAG: cardiolipin synthase [Gammaproteobacteria bacterium]|nr:cardiolipin synthase [Gammaproteobacteria bacterium]MBK81389.1 cardiolipin synthase [Gammaproteobacteria bacterium]